VTQPEGRRHTTTTWSPNAPTQSVGEAAPVHHTSEASVRRDRLDRVLNDVLAMVGWVLAALIVVGGGLLLWHLLFGGGTSDDVWLGQHAAITQLTGTAERGPED
jgi:hypothetical protein